MNITLLGLNSLKPKFVSRSLSCTSVLSIQKWREDRGLPVNKNAEGVLIDGPDYTFLDGRPTPLLQKQKQRMLQQQDYAKRIVEMCSELDFAKERHQDMLQAAEQDKEKIRKNWLKPKGKNITNK